MITSETQEGADFRGSLGRWDLPNSWQKALLGNPVSQVADLLCSKRAFLSPQLEIGAPESLKDLAKSSEMLLPRGGEDNYIG